MNTLDLKASTLKAIVVTNLVIPWRRYLVKLLLVPWIREVVCEQHILHLPTYMKVKWVLVLQAIGKDSLRLLVELIPYN